MTDNNKIYLSPPGFDTDSYVDTITKTLSDVGSIVKRQNVSAFESLLETYLDGTKVAALNSGTSALHLALKILGVDKGDKVICSTFTFVASANPILYCNAEPVFVDSEKDTWNMCPNFLKNAIEDNIKGGKKPKAIILVHAYGMPARLNEIMSIARHHDIPVIEDAAAALGSKFDNKPVGTFGDIGVFSFNTNKIVTSLGGGALVSDNSDYIEKARFLAGQARITSPYHQYLEEGFNYRMGELNAVIGKKQLEGLQGNIQKRRANFLNYQEAFKEELEIDFLKELSGGYSNRWLSTLLMSEEIFRKFRTVSDTWDNTIETRRLWKPLHLQPLFAGTKFYGTEVAEKLFLKGLCLPSGATLTQQERDRVINKIKELFEVT